MGDTSNPVMMSLGSLHKKIDTLTERVDKVNGNVRANTTDIAVLDATAITTTTCSEKQTEMAELIGERVMAKVTARNATFWQRFGATVLSGVVVAILVTVILKATGA